MYQVAIMGHGVVGSGVSELLLTHAEEYARRAGQKIVVKRILDLRDFPDHPLANCFTKDFNDILSDHEISLVAEVMGGLHPAYDYVKACLEAGKSVVTSNKELVAEKGAELLAIAQKKNVNFLFEASVGGGIPILRPMNQCLIANNIRRVCGILNGTTNFILTKMIREKMSFADALALAQKSGYAERNPAADVEGLDAGRKICILASLAYGKHIYPKDISTEGITAISLEDVAYAEQINSVIKLIGQTQKAADGKLFTFVSPLLISKSCLLANVEDVFNAVLVDGDATDAVVFYGKGAGKLPTASAVVADLLDCIAHAEKRRAISWEDSDRCLVAPMEEHITAMYYRVQYSGKNAQACIENAFGAVQLLQRENQPAEEYAFVTQALPEKALAESCNALQKEGFIVQSVIRIADF